MSGTQIWQENIVETKKCLWCGEVFNITDKDKEFYLKISPSFKWQRFEIPSPTLCPECRLRRRLSFRNERSLYKRKLDSSEKEIIAMYSPDKEFEIYEQWRWWQDDWDPKKYGKDFDFSRPFFEQFEELQRSVPRSALLTSWNENSDFTNYSSYLKDCYLLFDSSNCENFYYWYNIGKAHDWLDSSIISDWDNIYECIDCVRVHNLFFSQNCSDCSDSHFLSDCIGCKNCIWCSNLSNKQYYFENEYVWAQRYEEILKEMKKDFVKYKSIYQEISKTYIKRHAFLVWTEKVYGNSMISSTSCYSCYDWIYFENCKYFFQKILQLKNLFLT